MHPTLIAHYLAVDHMMKGHRARRRQAELEAAEICRKLWETNERAKRWQAETEHRGHESRRAELAALRRELLEL